MIGNILPNICDLWFEMPKKNFGSASHDILPNLLTLNLILL